VVATHIRGVIDAMKAQSVEQTPALHAARSSLFARIKWGLSYLLVSSVDYTIGRRIKFGLLRRKG
jgi:cardiolipin synthase A/B